MRFFKNTNSEISIRTIAKVNQLTAFDMIYVYHLLSKGTKLKLIKSAIKLNGELEYKVMFKSFKLGYITLSNISKLMFNNEKELTATVFSTAKEKYLPLKSLEISISKNEFKMVG